MASRWGGNEVSAPPTSNPSSLGFTSKFLEESDSFQSVLVPAPQPRGDGAIWLTAPGDLYSMGMSVGEQVPCIQMKVLVADEEERMSARSSLEDFLEIDRCPGV